MELSYWQSRWKKGKIGFHMPDGYPGLKKYWGSLNLKPHPTVLVPLCGKTIDLAHLAQLGATVVGVEISERAILEFFNEQNLSFETDTFADFTIRKSENIELWEGDFFKFPTHKHPSFDLIYDKAALVALPPKMRKRYGKKLSALSSDATSILLHHFIYSQEQMSGPPFSVSVQEVEVLFSNQFRIQLLYEYTIPAEKFPQFQRRGLKSPLKERLLYLRPHP